MKLNELTESQCFEFYEKALKNSEQRWKTAELIASKEDYGGAIKDLVTSIEELVKAIIMLADARGFEFRKSDGMERIILKSHSLRHFIAFGMYVFNNVTEDLRDFFIKLQKKPSELKILFKPKYNLEDKLHNYMSIKLIEIRRELNNFSILEKDRQLSSHVDLLDYIHSPQSISKIKYMEIYQRLFLVKSIGAIIIEILNSNEELDNSMIEKAKKIIIDNKGYNEISFAIKAFNKNNSPFKLAEKKISDFENI